MNRRNTIQKELVLEAVRSLKTHPTAEEIYESILSSHPTIGKGTVYRNLNILSQTGDIKKVRISDGPDHFDFNCSDHYHVSCVQCGKVYDVDMDVLPDLTKKIKDKHGMTILDYDVSFRGVCVECQQAKALMEKDA